MIKKANAGFTVVELLITIGICGVIIPTIALGMTNLAVLNNRARDLSLVNMIAQNKVELLRSSGYNSVAIGTTDFSSELPNVLASPKTATYTVTSPSSGLKEISVTVTYKEYKTTRTVNYKSAISEIGVGQ